MSNFLKSAALRDISTYSVAQMSERDCVNFFALHRWGSVDKQVCPTCGTVDSHYRRPEGTRWRCRHCETDFSIFKGSVFQDTKMSYKKLLLGMKLFVEGAKGVASHHLARNMDCQVKSAHVFSSKLREALWRDRTTTPLQGLIHIDGGYFGGRPRKGNKRYQAPPQTVAERVLALHGTAAGPRAKAKPTTSPANFRRRLNRRVVLVMREVSEDANVGGLRTITAVVPAETEQFVLPLIQAFVAPGSWIMTDESPAYSRLNTMYKHETVNHQVEFSTEDGVQENQAEAFFSRLRRNVLGISHRATPKYLGDLANEMAWRDDVRRCTEAEKLAKLLHAVFSHGLSRWFRGYWQGLHRTFDLTWQHDLAQAMRGAA